MKWRYFSTLRNQFENNSIQTLEDGTKVFCIDRLFGRSYIVPSVDFENRLRLKIRRFYPKFILFCGLFGGLLGPLTRRFTWVEFLLFILIISLGGALATRLYFLPFTREMELSPTKLSLRAHWNSATQDFHPIHLIALVLGCIFFLIGSVWEYSRNHDGKLLIGGAFFGLCLIPAGWMLWKRLSTIQQKK